MKRLQCLWITRQDPRPANSGELIYSWGLLSSLAETGECDITVLAHEAPWLGVAELAQECIRWVVEGGVPRSRIGSIFSQLPSDAWRLGNPLQRANLRTELKRRNWDWALIDQAACAWALGELPTSQRVAYLAHNHEATTRREVAAAPAGGMGLRMMLKLDAHKYARMEHRLCTRASLITAITPRDAAAFRSDYPGTPIIVLTPGFVAQVDAAGVAPALPPHDRRVVLSGAFEWLAKRANLEAFVRAAEGHFARAGIELLVVGKGDPAWMNALAANRPWLRCVPNVAAMAPYLASARIGVIPEQLGGGFKLKALDYVFAGLPVAALAPALSGMPLQAGAEAIVANDLDELVAAIVGALDDPSGLTAMAARAAQACSARFEWGERARELADALRAIA
jgi:glycosyltransferase involved in cell wall biosynthesis